MTHEDTRAVPVKFISQKTRILKKTTVRTSSLTMKKMGDIWKAERNVKQCSLLWLLQVLPWLANTVDSGGKS